MHFFGGNSQVSNDKTVALQITPGLGRARAEEREETLFVCLFVFNIFQIEYDKKRKWLLDLK